MYDVAIIGAGPAGASAAIFCAKAGKRTLVIDNDQSITRRAWIENHYGIPQISGPDLVETEKNRHRSLAPRSSRHRRPMSAKRPKASGLKPTKGRSPRAM